MALVFNKISLILSNGIYLALIFKNLIDLSKVKINTSKLIDFLRLR